MILIFESYFVYYVMIKWI